MCIFCEGWFFVRYFSWTRIVQSTRPPNVIIAFGSFWLPWFCIARVHSISPNMRQCNCPVFSIYLFHFLACHSLPSFFEYGIFNDQFMCWIAIGVGVGLPVCAPLLRLLDIHNPQNATLFINSHGGGPKRVKLYTLPPLKCNCLICLKLKRPFPI